jgi:peptidoglycan/LPS O-acetylase OafA/YrhL
MATELRYLTGSRGYAASGVVAAHVIGTFNPSVPSWMHELAMLGPKGVVVFFVLSAFTISLSIDGRAFSARDYAVRRFFRIAPGYYLMLALTFLLGGSYWAQHFSTPFDWKSLLFHLTFLNWIDYRHTNNALGVEWTLSIEVFFYMLLPGMLALSRNALGITLLTAGGLLALVIPHSETPSEAWWWSPAPFAVCFVGGVLAYRAWPFCSEWRLFTSGILLVPVVVILLVWRPVMLFELETLAWMLGTVVAILSGRSAAIRWIFDNRLAHTVGARSYALYLVHLPILGAVLKAAAFLEFSNGDVAAALTMAFSVAAVLLMYRYVELPAQAYGRRLIRERRAVAAAE